MSSTTATSDFAALGTPETIVRQLRQMKIGSPTPVQAATLADSLSGVDVAAQAPTGSGKTIAFAIPIVAKLAGSGASKPQRPRAVVLAPTRELADQIADVLADLAPSAGLRVLSLVGGENVNHQTRLLAAPVDIAVITPGRAHDLKRRNLLSLDDTEIIVVDEADMMAEMGFFPEVVGLVRACPPEAQRLLFSATLNADAIELIRDRRKEDQPLAQHVVKAKPIDLKAMQHVILRVKDNEAADEIVSWIASRRTQCVIFANTKNRVMQLTKMLQFYDINVDSLHGDRGLTARREVLRKFNAGEVNVLVCTDVAARGIDIDQLDLVVHADPPMDSATYIHRSGRTARAGNAGLVAMIVRDRQIDQAREVLESAGVTAEEMAAAPGRPVFVKLLGARRPRRRVAEREASASGTRGGTRGSARGTGKKGGRVHRPKRTKKNKKK